MDYRARIGVSNALWVPLIWLLIIASKPISQWVYPEAVAASAIDYEEGSPIDRLVFSLIIFSALLILSRRSTSVSEALRSSRWILIWLLFCGISMAWSDFPGISFKRWIKGIGSVLMVLIVLTEPNPFESVKALIRRCGYVLIPLSMLFIKYYRHLGVQYDPWEGQACFVGVTNNKNTLGRLCLVCGLFFFWFVVEMWRNRNISADRRELFVNVVFLIMTLWLLKISDSATSLGTLIIGIVVFTVLGFPAMKRNIKYMGALILFSISILFIIQMSFDFDIIGSYVAGLGRNMTLTGRTDLWNDVIQLQKSPLFGTGYGSFWLGDRLGILWGKYWWQPTEAHNGYLEIFLQLGLVGLFLLIIVILRTYGNILRALTSNFEYGRLRMVLFVVILLYNVTEAGFELSSMMFFVFLLSAAEVPDLPRAEVLEGGGKNGSPECDTRKRELISEDMGK